MRKLIWVVIALLAVMPVLADDVVVVNSREWQDVYSGVQYAKLKGLQSRFITDQAQALKLPSELNRANTHIVLEGLDNFAPGYGNILISRGFNAETIRAGFSANLELAQRLADEDGIRKFIVVDDSTGYNALAAAPYAVASKSFVIFANAGNIDDVVDFFNSNAPQSMIIYGHVRREVSDALERYNPTLVDKGSRFDNNIEMAGMFLQIKGSNQTILSNGEFIEDEIMSGKDPVIFIGRNNIPDGTKEFIQSTGITYGVLIGNELLDTGTFVKRELGLSVFVKFAKSSVKGGGEPELMALDQFPVPRHGLAIDVAQIRYNLVTRMLEVRYTNVIDAPAYLKSTIIIDELITGDQEPVFIDGLQEKTVLYDADLPDDLSGVYANFTVLYGESPLALEFLLQKDMTLSTIRVIDESSAEIRDAYYSPSRGRFVISVENTGDTEVFVNAEIIDILIDQVETTIASEGAESIAPGEVGEVTIRQSMSPADLEDNDNIKARIYYGERETALVKTAEADLPLVVKTNTLTYVISGATAVVVLLFLFFLFRKKRRR